MIPQIPGYLFTFEFMMRVSVVAIALGLIWMGAFRMEGLARRRYALAAVVSAVLIAWLAIAQYLGAKNLYFATAKPTLLLGFLTPLIVAAAALRFSKGFAGLVSAIPLPWIVAAQIYRVDGVIFLVLWADGRLPSQFALPAGIGDVVTGVFAIVVARLLARKTAGARRAAIVWCLFGITDLVVAMTMGALTSPGRVHFLALDAPNLFSTSYPLVMIPTFAVPIALILHGIALSRLGRETASRDRLATA